MAPQVTIFFHKIETTRNACTKRVGFKNTFIVGESLIKCAVPKPIQRARPQVTPKVVKTQLKKTPSKNILRNARKRPARALRKKEAQKESIEVVLAELSGTSPMVTKGKNTSSTLAVPTPKRINATQFFQIMIGSISVNLYPTNYVLMTSTNETSEEGQKDESVTNVEVQRTEPQSNLLAHVVESTLQEVYPCSHTSSTKEAREKGMIIPELSSLNSTRLDDCLQWNPLYDDPISQTPENDCIASQGAKLHEGVESMQVMMTGTSNIEDQLPLIQEMMQDLKEKAVIEKKSDKGQSKDPLKRPTLKEHKKVKYSFGDEDVEEIFDQLLASNGITLLESKRPAEANKTNNPRYCRYHHLVSHMLKDCYILKDKIQELLNNSSLVIDSSPRHHSATANMIDGLKLAGINTVNRGTIVHACPNAPWSSDLQIPTLHELTTAPSLEI
ncbi:hypothetical protein L3X38_032429 [Prunus dulcis]|uniref:Retrotransposon gag protein n=1 Tax=Prunus dulcis TaxID=3755 RepID=A0AAD4VGB1_PRUDU|nr:hypothetical protein L3X38_032429 [Prunus dulcis]